MRNISEQMIIQIRQEMSEVLKLAEDKAARMYDHTGRPVNEATRQELHNQTLRTLQWVLYEAKRLNGKDSV
jgi:hypothetical protein